MCDFAHIHPYLPIRTQANRMFITTQFFPAFKAGRELLHRSQSSRSSPFMPLHCVNSNSNSLNPTCAVCFSARRKSLNKIAPFRGMICVQFRLLIGQKAKAELYGSTEVKFDLWRGSVPFIHHLLLPDNLLMLPMGISPLCWDSSVSLASSVYVYFFPDCSQGITSLTF